MANITPSSYRRLQALDNQPQIREQEPFDLNPAHNSSPLCSFLSRMPFPSLFYTFSVALECDREIIGL